MKNKSVNLLPLILITATFGWSLTPLLSAEIDRGCGKPMAGLSREAKASEEQVRTSLAFLKNYAANWEGQESSNLATLERALPAGAIPGEAIAKAMEELSPLKQTALLTDLAKLHRKEAVTLIREKLKTFEPVQRYYLCEAMTYLNEAEGLEYIEKLYRESRANPRDKTKAVPLTWIIQDLLTDTLGTPKAIALRDRLISQP